MVPEVTGRVTCLQCSDADGVVSVLWSWLFSAVLFPPGELFHLLEQSAVVFTSALQLCNLLGADVGCRGCSSCITSAFYQRACSYHSHPLLRHPNTSLPCSAFMRKQMEAADFCQPSMVCAHSQSLYQATAVVFCPFESSISSC